MSERISVTHWVRATDRLPDRTEGMVLIAQEVPNGYHVMLREVKHVDAVEGWWWARTPSPLDAEEQDPDRELRDVVSGPRPLSGPIYALHRKMPLDGELVRVRTSGHSPEYAGPATYRRGDPSDTNFGTWELPTLYKPPRHLVAGPDDLWQSIPASFGS